MCTADVRSHLFQCCPFRLVRQGWWEASTFSPTSFHSLCKCTVQIWSGLYLNWSNESGLSLGFALSCMWKLDKRVLGTWGSPKVCAIRTQHHLWCPLSPKHSTCQHHPKGGCARLKEIEGHNEMQCQSLDLNKPAVKCTFFYQMGKLIWFEY